MKLLVAIISLALGACIHLRTCITLAIGLSLCSCSTTVHHANGSAWIRSYSNIKHLEAHSGTESILIDGLNNSTPTRASAKFADIIGSTAASIAVPGSGVTPLIGRAAINATPTVKEVFSKPGD